MSIWGDDRLAEIIYPTLGVTFISIYENINSATGDGYKKDPENSKQWIIDKPAAKVVRYIFQLCLEGLGITKIACRLEAEKVLTPTAYCESIAEEQKSSLPVPLREKFWEP